MKKIALIIAAVLTSTCTAFAKEPIKVLPEHVNKTTQWNGKRVGILGDSMSDPATPSSAWRFYSYLEQMLGIEPFSYAISGYQWKDLLGRAKAMKAEHPDDLDAILIWAGTNDYNHSLPIGDFFVNDQRMVNVNGTEQKRTHRTHVMADSTYCGSINTVMSYLKEQFPEQQIIILTPIHRGYANFGPTNIQPDEEYANGAGYFIDDYASTLHKAGEVWSVPVIDLFSLSGIYPLYRAHDRYVGDITVDRLHPSDEGNYRIALLLANQLPALPANFKINR